MCSVFLHIEIELSSEILNSVYLCQFGARQIEVAVIGSSPPAKYHMWKKSHKRPLTHF
jgi:hypothetical protein